MKLKQKKRKPTSGLIKVNGKLIHSATGRDAVEQCTDNSTSRGPTFDAAAAQPGFIDGGSSEARQEPSESTPVSATIHAHPQRR